MACDTHTYVMSAITKEGHPAVCVFLGQLYSAPFASVSVRADRVCNWGPHATHMSGDNATDRTDIGEQW